MIKGLVPMGVNVFNKMNFFWACSDWSLKQQAMFTHIRFHPTFQVMVLALLRLNPQAYTPTLLNLIVSDFNSNSQKCLSVEKTEWLEFIKLIITIDANLSVERAWWFNSILTLGLPEFLGFLSRSSAWWGIFLWLLLPWLVFGRFNAI